jgi:hypothetical protein
LGEAARAEYPVTARKENARMALDPIRKCITQILPFPETILRQSLFVCAANRRTAV